MLDDFKKVMRLFELLLTMEPELCSHALPRRFHGYTLLGDHLTSHQEEYGLVWWLILFGGTPTDRIIVHYSYGRHSDVAKEMEEFVRMCKLSKAPEEAKKLWEEKAAGVPVKPSQLHLIARLAAPYQALAVECLKRMAANPQRLNARRQLCFWRAAARVSVSERISPGGIVGSPMAVSNKP